jgi:glucosylglycerol 3-phosphatase
MPSVDFSLHTSSFSLDHQALSKLIIERDNVLIIQDLDGVCMGLVKDPLTRIIDPRYLTAIKSLAGQFFVLTNGEHIGKRGVNSIVEKAVSDVARVKQEGLYLPGLAGGGVQWQDCYGNISHPGVSQAELDFLAAIPQKITDRLEQLVTKYDLKGDRATQCIEATVLDNLVSPTANLNVFHEVLSPSEYADLQQEMHQLMTELLEASEKEGLGDSFFVHYASNLGRDDRGIEIMQPASGQDSGTTDFQFMLRGAIKEVGVLVILNHYYYLQTGRFPLGKDFNARQAPAQHSALLDLVQNNFADDLMPTIIGVGDTVTSKAQEIKGTLQFRRGGSDRGFLELIQAIGKEYDTGNIVVYVDSSRGEVKNRKPLKFEGSQVVEGPGDSRDTKDPLTLNVVFPGGHEQYIDFLVNTALSKNC